MSHTDAQTAQNIAFQEKAVASHTEREVEAGPNLDEHVVDPRAERKLLLKLDVSQPQPTALTPAPHRAAHGAALPLCFVSLPLGPADASLDRGNIGNSKLRE